MSPRSSVAGAAKTRSKIVTTALRIAANEGFQATTLGRLAGELRMSKSGVIGPFGTMDELQLAAVTEAIQAFTLAVWKPAARETPGLPRLLRICETWLDYISGTSYVGGCFTSAEHHPSQAVRAAVADALRGWRQALASDVEVARLAGDLRPEGDAMDVAFELNAIALGAAQARRLDLDPVADQRAMRAMRRVLT